MTASPTTIPLSALKALGYTEATFAKDVQAFKAAKEAHLNTVGVPAPRSQHAIIEKCVRRERVADNKPDRFVIDYEIVNDLLTED